MSGNVITSWKYDKNEKKMNFIKYYEDLNSYTICKIKNSDIPLIALGNEKLIFYNVDDKSDLIFIFNYELNYFDSYETRKVFYQDEKYFYALILGLVFIFTINYKKKKLIVYFNVRFLFLIFM